MDDREVKATQGKTSEEREVLRREGVKTPSRLERSGRIKKESRLPEPVRNFWRRHALTKWLIILVASVVLLFGGYLFILSKSANVEDLQSALQATTIIYDQDGVEAGSLSGQKGTYVELDAISSNLVYAVIATEDRTFYENSGINYPRFIMAILSMGKTGGGSTITQQLAKNAYLTQEQTITRKAKEFFLALELTKKYSKDEILTMYLNNAYFGHGVWGIEDASLKYFGVSASQVTVDQAATLIGILKGPSLYNPIDNLENAINRRNTVLQSMVDAEFLAQDKADEFMTYDMASQLVDRYVGQSDNYTYPSYFDAVIAEAESKYGLTENEIVNNGYRIYTELNQTYQANMQLIYDNEFLFPISTYDNTYAQSASVALDPATGGVRGVVGRINSGENYTYRSFNYATQAGRSPGSTIKPLVDYAPALAEGWSIEEALNNEVTTYEGNYTVENYQGLYADFVTVPMYEAVAQSLNVPAVWTLNQLGVETAFTYGKRFGLNMDGVNKTLGVALGAGVATNPLEMAQAYATFANDGVMREAHFITRIENASGRVIKKARVKSSRVVSRSVAKQMTAMLLGTFSNGSGIYANPYGYTMAGKTGTTETDFNPDLTSDQWVIGYTPDLVISQWLGFDQTDENHYLEGASSGDASTIFNTVASNLLPYTAQTAFTVENAYAAKGIAAVALDSPEETLTTEETDVLASIGQEAEHLINQASERLKDYNIPETAQTIWDNITSFFE